MASRKRERGDQPQLACGLRGRNEGREVIDVESSPVPPSQWQAFFDRFSRLHHGQKADIETIDPDATVTPQARDLPLLGVTAEGDQRIDVVAADEAGTHVRHAIARPIALRAAEWNDGVSAELLIESADGRTTRVRVGPPRQMLAPGMVLDGHLSR